MLGPSVAAGRRAALRAATAPAYNGIDSIEVGPDQRALVLRFVFPLPGPGRAGGVGGVAPQRHHLTIEGGARVRGLRVLSAELDGQDACALHIRVDRPGDFSIYTLRVRGADGGPLPGFDPVLSEVAFSFKVDCPAAADCREPATAAPPPPPAPAIDYLARDFNGFRRLMFDRMAALLPDWNERSPADMTVMLVELLASRADHLAYFQDAVATEGYLDTARRRVSLRRHARLLDYPVHEGQSARVLVALEAPGEVDDKVLPAGTPLLTRVNAAALARCRNLPPSSILEQLRGAQVFETLHDLTLRTARNQIGLHTFGEARLCLPQGSTRATLRDPGEKLRLRPGDLLIFEEVRDPDTLRPEQADPAHRHAVRLCKVSKTADPLTPHQGAPLPLLQVEWHAEDALPFALRLTAPERLGAESVIAHGNVVLSDHGCTVGMAEALSTGGEPGIALPTPDVTGQLGGARYRPRLPHRRLAHAEPYDHEQASGRAAAAMLRQEPRRALPQVVVTQAGAAWRPRRDLLGADRDARHFVVEFDDEDRAALRFGDGISGRRPEPGFPLRVVYRVGGGAAGNVGQDEIAHVLPWRGLAGRGQEDTEGAVPLIRYDGIRARNPLPAQGGVDPEPLPHARRAAPEAFKEQIRAVSAEDYVAHVERHPEVQRAAATLRWTGSYHAVRLTIDRRGGGAIDDALRARLRAHLSPCRLAGHELEIEAPRFVPLDLELAVRPLPSHGPGDVEQALRRALTGGPAPGGALPFFHPDRFTFGQPVYASEIIAHAMKVPGVAAVLVRRLQRFGGLDAGERAAGVLRCHPLEIVRLDDDPNAPEHGRLTLLFPGAVEACS